MVRVECVVGKEMVMAPVYEVEARRVRIRPSRSSVFQFGTRRVKVKLCNG